MADITITAHWVTREPAKGGGTLHFLMAGEVVLAMIDEYETECAIKYRVLGAQYIVDYVAQSLEAAKAYVAEALRGGLPESCNVCKYLRWPHLIHPNCRLMRADAHLPIKRTPPPHRCPLREVKRG